MSKVNQNRRNFIKKGVTGLAGAALLPSVLSAGVEEQRTTTGKKREFIYRTLGKTGIKLPIISMGSSYNIKQVKTALEAGIIHIFTSSEYRDGKDETDIGTVIKSRPRNSFVLATGFYSPPYQDVRTRHFRKNIPGKILAESFEGSLKRLGLAYVDIFYLSGVASRGAVMYEPFIQVLQKFKEQGKARFIGVSTHMNEPEVIRAAVDSKVYDVVMTAYNFRQLHREEVKKAIAYAAGAGMGIVAMKTMAGGYWDKERKHPINSKAALKWVLNDTNVHSVISGFSNFQEMEQSLAVMEDLALTPGEKKDLMMDDNSEITGLYCAQCGKCISQCRVPWDIPTAMRSYMYAYGYKSPAQAKETLLSLGLPCTPCVNCGTCSVECSMGFDIRNRVLDISRIMEVPDEFLV